MKEAFWGTLIVILGLFGIVVVNIFQNVTIDNDRVYYLIKETTEASAFDALDLTYYRLSGTLRITEDKFVENLTRRFAENVTIGDYTIVVQDINEMPPKVSVWIRSGITSIRGEEFGIQNRVDGILETKYGLSEVLDFLDITEDEWKELTEEVKIEVDENTGENICNVGTITDEEMECIPGDMMFDGFESVDMKSSVCQDETLPGNKVREARYKVCNCGKWEEAKENVTASPVKNGNVWTYTWTFNKTGEVRTIRESIKQTVKIEVCTTAIGEMVPKDVNDKLPDEDGDSYEPSKDNSKYVACPPGGIRIPVGMKFTMHPNYVPTNSINRNLEWTVGDSSILGIQSSNPSNACELNASGTNCFSKAIVTAKKVGTTSVNVKTTRGQTATCKIEVFDGNVDSVSCKDLTLEYGATGVMKSSYSPKNAVNTKFTWSISDSSIATINKNSGAVEAKKSGTATVTVTAPGGKTGTCTLKVNKLPSGGSTSVSTSGSCSCVHNVPTGQTKQECLTGGSYKCNVTYTNAAICGYKTCKSESCGYYSCSRCGYNTCSNSACGAKTCRTSACGCAIKIGKRCLINARCQSSACGYNSCATPGCGYKSCHACGVKSCKTAACGAATCTIVDTCSTYCDDFPIMEDKTFPGTFYVERHTYEKGGKICVKTYRYCKTSYAGCNYQTSESCS